MNALNPQTLVKQLVAGNRLSERETHAFFSDIVRGALTDIQLAAAITAMNVRGETTDELTGAATALVESAAPFPRPSYPFADIVGTGGDGQNTLNLSTIAALTAAACGCKIVKHGNRSITSCSGSFDLLESLGIHFDLSPERARKLVDELGICFLFAPKYHSGLKHAAAVRRALQVRTIFNLLGPLVNPARPPIILLGVAKPELLTSIANVLANMGCQRAMVVHGRGMNDRMADGVSAVDGSGVDEIAIHGPSTVVEIDAGNITQYEVVPGDFGASTHPLAALTCDEARESHRRSAAVLRGQGSEAENAAVCANVAMLMKLFGNSELKSNYAAARNHLETGKPMELVARMIEVAR